MIVLNFFDLLDLVLSTGWAASVNQTNDGSLTNPSAFFVALPNSFAFNEAYYGVFVTRLGQRNKKDCQAPASLPLPLPYLDAVVKIVLLILKSGMISFWGICFNICSTCMGLQSHHHECCTPLSFHWSYTHAVESQLQHAAIILMFVLHSCMSFNTVYRAANFTNTPHQISKMGDVAGLLGACTSSMPGSSVPE